MGLSGGARRRSRHAEVHVSEGRTSKRFPPRANRARGRASIVDASRPQPDQCQTVVGPVGPEIFMPEASTPAAWHLQRQMHERFRATTLRRRQAIERSSKLLPALIICIAGMKSLMSSCLIVSAPRSRLDRGDDPMTREGWLRAPSSSRWRFCSGPCCFWRCSAAREKGAEGARAGWSRAPLARSASTGFGPGRSAPAATPSSRAWRSALCYPRSSSASTTT
jgi:hypothetical protein